MAYIDSEIAKRRFEGLQAQAQALSPSPPPATSALSTSSATTKTDPTLTRQPATIGKLQEIDLGDEERSLNVQRTQKAQRMLNGEVVDEEGNKKPVKVRLGPDGKPWRGRKRRGSDDIKRDKLVEDVLRENGRMCSLFMRTVTLKQCTDVAQLGSTKLLHLLSPQIRTLLLVKTSQQTTVLLKLSGGNSWMPSLKDRGRSLRKCNRQPEALEARRKKRC